MARLVQDDGPSGARIVVIGEAPGRDEEAQGRPFVGQAGRKLDEWLRLAGLNRPDLYVTNTYPFRPPGNKIGAIPKPELAEWVGRLHDRLAQLADPWVLVPTGNIALRALIGQSGIVNRRGSIYEYLDRRGRRIKVIPAIHPAAIFRKPIWEKRSIKDWQRIASDAQFRELRLPVREHLTRPTLDDLRWMLEQARRAEKLALDIETPRRIELVEQPPTKTGKARKPKRVRGARRISCLAFSVDPALSLTVPTTPEYWRDPEMLDEAWRLIREILATPTEKVLHNGLFDAYWLAEFGVWLPQLNWRWDTLSMHHALDSADEHKLAYCASLDTRQPFWKDMKDTKEDDDAGEPANLDVFWRYNGIDACVTRELADVYLDRLRAAQLDAFCDRHYRRMAGPLLSIMQHGIRVDGVRRAARAAELADRCVAIRTQLAGLAGEPLHGPKGDLSAKRVQRFLYQTLKLPPRVKDGKITAREVAVRQLMLQFPEVLGEAGALILEHRRQRKLLEFLAAKVADPDGRIRCSYKFTTQTGRLASAANPKGTGRNLQNIDREVRDTFLPDEGRLLMEIDLSQAESRVVGLLTRDPEMIRLARLAPWEFDVHRRNAAIIFGIPADDVSREQRYLGKRAVHASNYGMAGRKLSEVLLVDGYERTPDECQLMIDAYLDAHPPIRDWQRRVRSTVLRDRMLANPFGRLIDFQYDRMDDDLYRRAYAFVPQSTVADALNQWGLIPLDAEITRRAWRTRVNLQVHDSLVLSTPLDEAWDVYEMLRWSLERPLTIGGERLVIPVEAKLGRRWGCGTCLGCLQRSRCSEIVEFKKPPTRQEFMDVAEEMAAPVEVRPVG